MRGRGRGGGRGPSRGGGRAPSAPWSRLKPVELDPLDVYGLPSKGDNRLLDFKTQERYYTKIVERYMTFCSDAGERDELLRRFASLKLSPAAKPESSSTTSSPMYSPASTSFSAAESSGGSRGSSTANLTTDTKGLSDVLAALRKLREGIVASKRADAFAAQAYLFCIRLAVLVKHPETYQPAILHLLRRMHAQHALTSVEAAEVAGYLVLDTACRRGDLAEAYALRARHHLRDPKVDGVLDALAHDNYVRLLRLRRSVDGHKAKLIEYAGPAMRTHALKCFGRTYLNVDLEFLERCTDANWMDLISNDRVGWELEGSKVIIRKMKSK